MNVAGDNDRKVQKTEKRKRDSFESVTIKAKKSVSFESVLFSQRSAFK